MNKNALLRLLWLASTSPLLLSGCVPLPPPVVSTGAEVEVVGEAPTPLVEEVGPCPSPGFVWIGGAWVWQGRWEWEKGRWEHPPHPGAVWVPHRYVYHNGKHTFVRGGWH